MSKKIDKTIWIVLIAFFILLIIFMRPVGQSVSYDFSKIKTAEKWMFFNTSPKKTDDGIKISTKQTSLMLFSGQNLQDKAWQDLPFVVLRIKPVQKTRKLNLYWVPGKDIQNGLQLPVTIDRLADKIIINTQQQKKWKKMPGWNEKYYDQAKINRFGLVVPANQEIEIKRIELRSILNLFDLAKLIAREYQTAEPVKVSSINFQYGVSILSMPFAYALGIFLSVLGLTFLMNNSKLALTVLTVGSVACFIIYDITLNHTLFEHAQYSGQRSAWHDDKNDEYKSRFGRQFADLAKNFEEMVPLKSKVAFPWSKDYRVIGESNWMEFQYYALYQPKNLKMADYIFYYYPKKLIHDSKDNTVYYQDSRDRYKVKVLYSQSPSVKILKVIHD